MLCPIKTYQLSKISTTVCYGSKQQVIKEHLPEFMYMETASNNANNSSSPDILQTFKLNHSSNVNSYSNINKNYSRPDDTFTTPLVSLYKRIGFTINKCDVE